MSLPADGAIVAVTDDARFGPILTDESGMALYLFTADSPGVSTCVDGCLAAWPPLLTDGEPSVQGAADATLLGTLTRDDGSVQVTYAGWPLYFFAADMAPGDVTGQGVNDVWFVVAPKAVRSSAARSRTTWPTGTTRAMVRRPMAATATDRPLVFSEQVHGRSPVRVRH